MVDSNLRKIFADPYNTTIFNANKHEFVLYSYNAGNSKDMQLPDVYALDILNNLKKILN